MTDREELEIVLDDCLEEEAASAGLSECESKAISKFILDPTFHAALTRCAFENSVDDIFLGNLVKSLSDQVKLAGDGDFSRAKSMLISQAHTLDMLFNHLVKRSANNMSGFLDATETYMKLALRAQSQCRSTLATLADILKPDPVSLKNTVHGAQQINIHNPDDKDEPAGNRNPPNELLENKKHEPDKWLDGGAPEEAIGANQDVETVGKIDRSKVV